MTDKQPTAAKPSRGVLRSIAADAVAAKQFLILCPTATKSSGVLETLYALYYLPFTYRVRVEGHSDLLLNDMYALFRDDVVAERIEWNAEEIATLREKPRKASPFSMADVVVYGNARAPEPDMPAQSLVVFNLTGRQATADEDHRFSLAPSTPEALASAILAVTR